MGARAHARQLLAKWTLQAPRRVLGMTSLLQRLPSKNRAQYVSLMGWVYSAEQLTAINMLMIASACSSAVRRCTFPTRPTGDKFISKGGDGGGVQARDHEEDRTEKDLRCCADWPQENQS